MSEVNVWLIVGIVLCIAEMLSGTFFLLVVGLAAFVGALAAWLGTPVWAQALIAAAVAVIGVALVEAHRRKTKPKAMVSFDIGQPVTFDAWVSQPEGMARVAYRGSTWDARLPAGLDPAPGAILYIEAVNGNVFQVSASKPAV